MQAYRGWLQQNPGRVEQVESMVRMGLLMLTDRTNTFQTELGFNVVSALGHIHTCIPIEDFLHRCGFYHGLLKELQRSIELKFRFQDSPYCWHVVALVEAIKICLVLIHNRKEMLRMVVCVFQLMLRKKRITWSGHDVQCYTDENGNKREIPKVCIPRKRLYEGGESTVPPGIEETNSPSGDGVSIFYVLQRMLSVLYIVRPLLEIFALQRYGMKHPWRVWYTIVTCQVLGWYLSRSLLRNAPKPLVTLQQQQQPQQVTQPQQPQPPTPEAYINSISLPQTLTEEVVTSRLRLVFANGLRSPFFDHYFRGVLERYFVSGCFARIPLLGFMVAQAANHLLTLQEMTYFATSSS
eukprot:PhF_6_TR7053/c0_g1_i4/m.10628